MRLVGRPIATAFAFALAIALAGTFAGCSGGGAPSVTDAWIRVPMNATGPAGGFLSIANPGSSADALVGASSDAAAAVEIHETTMADDGTMGMAPIDRIELPAGGSVELKPGGTHLMLIGLAKPLTAGEKVTITLLFEHAGAVEVTAEVRAG